MLAWACFYVYRKVISEEVPLDHTVMADKNLYIGIIVIFQEYQAVVDAEWSIAKCTHTVYNKRHIHPPILIMH